MELMYSPPALMKEFKYLFGKINFVRNFVPNYASIFKPINVLLKKGNDLCCTPQATNDFNENK